MNKKVAFITGASRGIGKAIGLKLAKEGWNIAIAARSLKDRKILPGNIYSAAQEMEKLGAEVLAIPCDVTKIQEIENASQKTIDHFKEVDAVICNAGAIWPLTMDDTEMENFDQVMNTNVRASFAVTLSFLSHFKRKNSGHFIYMSPTIHLENLGGKVGYMISKYGMTMLMTGLAQELEGTGIYSSSLWPKTIIETAATINFKLGEPSDCRKPDIVADATWEMLKNPKETHGKVIIDEEFLRKQGYKDFDKYLSQEGGKPVDLPF